MCACENGLPTWVLGEEKKRKRAQHKRKRGNEYYKVFFFSFEKYENYIPKLIMFYLRKKREMILFVCLFCISFRHDKKQGTGENQEKNNTHVLLVVNE